MSLNILHYGDIICEYCNKIIKGSVFKCDSFGKCYHYCCPCPRKQDTVTVSKCDQCFHLKCLTEIINNKTRLTFVNCDKCNNNFCKSCCAESINRICKDCENL